MRDEFPQAGGQRPQTSEGAEDVDAKDTLTLRVLATTDLHMQLLGHDYVADRPLDHHGLAGLSHMISDARQEAEAQGYATLLLDNGDTFQGNALGDLLANQAIDKTHPGVAVCNHLRYDALGVGNHDLDHGLDYLRDIAAALQMPLISTNLSLKRRGALETSVLIHCPCGPDQEIVVGLVSVLPEHTAIWNSHTLGAENSVLPPLGCITDHVARLREKGADVIVLMAHMGIRKGKTDSAVYLAGIAGIDAVITGHTHRRFPGSDHWAARGIDPASGLLAGRPAVMPGHHGSDLGVLDLYLTRDTEGKLRVTGQQSELRKNRRSILPDPSVTAICRAAHDKTRKALKRPIGYTPIHLHNYFSLAMPTPTCAMLARAQALVIRDALADTPHGGLPLVAAVSAHTAGGRGGPRNYLHIPPGPILRRHIAGLAPYADQICALRTTGTGLRHWLEHAARVYRHLHRNNPTQQLIDPAVPPFNFDTIYGLNYTIDPTRPVGDRIQHLSFAGTPVAPDQSFVLVTNQFRAAGGGGIDLRGVSEVLHRSPVPIEKALAGAVQRPFEQVWDDHPPWRISCDDPVKAVLQTAPEAVKYLPDAAHLFPEVRGSTPSGFVSLQLTL